MVRTGIKGYNALLTSDKKIPADDAAIKIKKKFIN